MSHAITLLGIEHNLLPFWSRPWGIPWETDRYLAMSGQYSKVFIGNRN
jgi:hypothetical protein